MCLVLQNVPNKYFQRNVEWKFLLLQVILSLKWRSVLLALSVHLYVSIHLGQKIEFLCVWASIH